MCSECTGGKHQNLVAATAYNCKTCTKGQATADASTLCSECTGGKYQNLVAATAYNCKTCTVRMAAYNAEKQYGPSIATNPSNEVPRQYPANPTSVALEVATSTSLTASWNHLAVNTGGYLVESYTRSSQFVDDGLFSDGHFGRRGITYQQSSGNSGAHDDLRVVYKIMDRENLLIKIKTNATQYLTNHRWEAVSISSSVSSLNSKSKLLDSSVGAGAGVGAGNETNVSKGAILIETIRQDLLEVRRVSLIVVHYIWLWRQDQILTLHERQHPSEYPPKPFVYNGHDYILKMINDLNYLKDLQPITAWLGAPMIRNPFALLFDDPNCIDNLDMQFDGSLADLAGCAHI